MLPEYSLICNQFGNRVPDVRFSVLENKFGSVYITVIEQLYNVAKFTHCLFGGLV